MAFGKKKDKKKDKKNVSEAGNIAEGGGKKSRKKLLLLILLAAIALAAGFRFGLMERFGSGGSGTKASIPKRVEAYSVDTESVASITKALEDCGDELLLSMSGNGLPEDEDAEEGEEGAEAEAPGQDAVDTSEEPLHSNYYYMITADSEADLARYEEYLIGGMQDHELFTKRENTEKEYITAYERDAAIHSKQLLVLEIEYPLNDDPETGMFAIKLRLEPKQEKLQEGVTRDQAMQYFKGLDHELLGLEKPVSEYYLVMDMGRTYIDKNDCYGINVYNKGEGEGSYFVKKFYLSLEHKKLYEYLAGDLVGLQDNYTMNHLLSSNQNDSDLDALMNQSSTSVAQIGEN